MNTKYAVIGVVALVAVGAVAWGMSSPAAVTPEPVATTTPPATTPFVTPPTIAPYKSGVKGTVTLTHNCAGPEPVAMRGTIVPEPPTPIQCPNTPFATAVSVYRANAGVPFVIGNSDQNGAFQLSLPPGQYRVVAGNGSKLPLCTPVTVTVPASGYVVAEIECDSGIR